MTVNLSCKKENFPQVEMFLFSQEYDKEPEFDKVVVDSESETYTYTTQCVCDKWYIVTSSI